tara:strand:- start:32 stop:670 length:639 start_codon:yes stop_codon:yes gene_type:complete
MDKIEYRIRLEQWAGHDYVRDFYHSLAYESGSFPKWLVEERKKINVDIIKGLWKTPPDKRYGISIEEVIDICETNCFACGSCGIPFELIDWNINIDHDHELDLGDENYIRGVLCVPCNRNLYSEHNIKLIESGRAKDYLTGEGHNYTKSSMESTTQFFINRSLNSSKLVRFGVPIFDPELNIHDLDRKYRGYKVADKVELNEFLQKSLSKVV